MSAKERLNAREAKRQAKSPLKDSPLGAGGFEFGESRSGAEQICRESEHTWTARDARAVCGGTVAKNADRPTKTVLQFCDDFLCGVTLRVEPNGNKKKDKTWVRELVRLRRKLTHKYGQWTSSVTPPHWCRHDVLKCLADGSAKYKYVWAWDTGERIVLKLENKSSSKLGPIVKIIYATPERGGADVL